MFDQSSQPPCDGGSDFPTGTSWMSSPVAAVSQTRFGPAPAEEPSWVSSPTLAVSRVSLAPPPMQAWLMVAPLKLVVSWTSSPDGRVWQTSSAPLWMIPLATTSSPAGVVSILLFGPGPTQAASPLMSTGL